MNVEARNRTDATTGDKMINPTTVYFNSIAAAVNAECSSLYTLAAFLYRNAAGVYGVSMSDAAWCKAQASRCETAAYRAF